MSNACATQAIVNILLNASDRVEIGDMLKGFKSFTNDMSPDVRGDIIGQHADIRKAHNSFARAEPFVMANSKATSDDDDVFHFIAYAPIRGKVYEMDGLKNGPIQLGETGTESWIAAVRPEIQKRMSKFKPGEIHFNLMAIVKDRRLACGEEIEKLESEIKEIESKSDEGPQMMAQESIAAKTSRVKVLKEEIEKEEAKRARWAIENKRRRHNYVPFIVALLRRLAKENKLAEMRAEGKKYVHEMVQKKRDAEKTKTDATNGASS